METGKNYHDSWTKRVQLFADGVGKPLDEVNTILVKLTGEPTDEKAATQALEVLSNKEAVSDAELKEAFKELSIPSGVLNLNIAKLRGVPAKVETATVATPTMDILPPAPTEESFLAMLKVGGVLKVETTEVVSAVKAAFAKRVRLYELPELLMKKMEEFALKQEEPCGEAFYKTQKLLTQKRYGDVLSVLGVDGNYVSEARKKEFFNRLDQRLWSSLDNFQTQLNGWYETWIQNASNPAMLGMVLAAAAGGNKAGLPPGLSEAPDTASIRAAAEDVVNDVNRIFAGPGIPVARALAYDATRIMGILNEPGLSLQIGAANKEQMLKELGINVGADLVRTEQNIIRYTLAVMALNKVTADTESLYLGAMVTLGKSINWKTFSGKSVSGIGATV